MSSWIKNNLGAFILAVLIHVGFVVLMIFSLDWDSAPEPVVNVVKATVVNEKQVLAEIEKLKKAEKRKLDNEKNRKKKAEKELQKIKKARQKEEEKRKKEQKRIVDLKKLKEKEKKEAEELAIKRKMEQKKIEEKQAVETKRLKEVEKKRKEEERKLAEAEFQRKLDEEILNEQAAVNKREADTERDRRALTEVEKFISLIHQDVTSSWILPANFKSGSRCTVRVKIIPGGEVADVKVSKCTGGVLFERSVDAAVRRASPLPVPKDPYVFDKIRDIDFLFNPS